MRNSIRGVPHPLGSPDDLPVLSVPAVAVVSVNPGEGKTVVACAVAAYLRTAGRRVAVCKPVAMNCARRFEGLVSPDAEMLAYYADTEFPLETIAPVRYVEPGSPAAAAEVTGRGVDFSAIAQSLREMNGRCDAMVIESVGAAAEPLSRDFSALDVLARIGAGVVLVVRSSSSLGAAVAAAAAMHARGLNCVGFVVAGYDPSRADPAEEAALGLLPGVTGMERLAILPDEKGTTSGPHIPAEVWTQLQSVDWARLAGH